MKSPRIYFALGRADGRMLEALRGRPVLESFAYQMRSVDRYRPTWSSAFLDSGAFTEMTTGEVIDLDAYVEFCQVHGEFYEVIANLDDIEGDVERSRRNHRRLLDAGVPAMPVFHQGEPWSVLDEVIASAPRQYIGLGFRRPIQGAETWLEDVFSRVPAGVRVHGFAMTSYLQFPFASVDSSTWVYEMNAILSAKGQGASALQCLTPGKILEIVIKKYERMERRRLWQGKRTGDLFEMVS